MAFRSNHSKNVSFTEVKKELPSSAILLNSRTVVEKEGFLSSGILTYVEGEMLETESSDDKHFHLGDAVKISAYTPAGIYTFYSTIIAKDHGSLMVINPPSNQRKFAEKREFPRVEAKAKGNVNGTPFRLKNISLSGIGFTILEEARFESNDHVEMDISLEAQIKIPLKAEIVRSEQIENGLFYGARYVHIEEDKINSLRAFILKSQVETYAKWKKQQVSSRIFR